MTAELVFWVSAALITYVYIGYPAILMLLRLVIRHPVKKHPITPHVSLLIPAYNEADVIKAKIENSLGLDYPPDRLEIVVASDGSVDGTTELARQYSDDRRMRVFDYPTNRGKISVLNESVPRLRGEIVVFSDASAMLEPKAVRSLVANFADPEVGAASGLYKIVKPHEADIGTSEDAYWKYETFLKIQESTLASVLGGHGHLHAIRKVLYPYPTPGTINDDYVIPLSVLQKGLRAVYEPEAVVCEEAKEMTGFGRRVRIMAGNLQQLRELKPLVWPLRPLPLFFFLSHKVGRLVVPFAMIAMLASNALLLSLPVYRALFWLQGAFYLLAALATIWPLKPTSLRLPYYFCMINLATFVGLYHALTSRRRMSWE